MAGYSFFSCTTSATTSHLRLWDALETNCKVVPVALNNVQMPEMIIIVGEPFLDE